MIDYLNNSGLEFHELDRVIKDGDTSVAEWEGVFELDNHVYFLECKHRVTAVPLSFYTCANITLGNSC